ncbi:MAG: gluconate 2-dehydrogenase subunit 3 family protein [Planctomycetia bacterium]
MDTPPDPCPDARTTHAGVARRDLLRGAAGAGLAASVAGFWLEGLGDPLRRWRLAPTPAGAPRVTLDATQWAVLAAALERLLPSEPAAPGAREVNAVGYLDRVLAEPELAPERHRDPILAGVPRLEALARERGAAGFAALAPEAQDEVLRSLEADPEGARWLRKVLYFGLEALLGDPVHGCQPGEQGWTWLATGLPGPRPTQPHWRPERR